KGGIMRKRSAPQVTQQRWSRTSYPSSHVTVLNVPEISRRTWSPTVAPCEERPAQSGTNLRRCAMTTARHRLRYVIVALAMISFLPALSRAQNQWWLSPSVPGPVVDVVQLGSNLILAASQGTNPG